MGIRSRGNSYERYRVIKWVAACSDAGRCGDCQSHTYAPFTEAGERTSAVSETLRKDRQSAHRREEKKRPGDQIKFHTTSGKFGYGTLKRFFRDGHGNEKALILTKDGKFIDVKVSSLQKNS